LLFEHPVRLLDGCTITAIKRCLSYLVPRQERLSSLPSSSRKRLVLVSVASLLHVQATSSALFETPSRPMASARRSSFVRGNSDEALMT
jgi:hypothetical protein